MGLEVYMAAKKELIGYITVDAGLVSIGDPCYQSDGQSDYADWNKFCDKLFQDQEFKKDNVYRIDHDGMAGKAMVFGTLYGDGIYPVSVNRDSEGRIKRR